MDTIQHNEPTFFVDDPNVQAALTDELNSYVSSLGLSPQPNSGPSEELSFDVWLPNLNVGIDLHDISGGRHAINERGFLRNKLLAARAANVKYVQFFSDEWNNKPAIVKSVVANACGATPIKLNARDCMIELVTSKETKPFLTEAHIQGGTRASDHLVMKHPDHGIIGSVTVRTPIQKKHGKVCELARVAFRPGFSVRGGTSKMTSYVRENIVLQKGFDGVLSYADLRFGSGSVYEQAGFSLVGETPVNYYYTNGAVRFDRFKYRAQPGKSEKLVVQDAGVRPVWGAGHRIFLWKPQLASSTES